MSTVNNRRDAIEIIKKAEGSIPDSKLNFKTSTDEELIEFANYLIILKEKYNISLGDKDY